MTRARIVFLVAGLLTLAGPAGAQAARTQVSADDPASAPYLAGDQVVYLRPTARNNLVLGASRTGVRTLRRLPVSTSDDDCCSTLFGVTIAASPTRLATILSREASAKGVLVDGSLKFEAGPLAGPPATIFECGAPGLAEFTGLDLDGDRLAYVRVACGQGDTQIVVRDLAAGADVASVPAPPGKTLWDVRLAGRYVAYSTSPSPGQPGAPRDVTVRDLQTGTDLFTVPALALFDLQSDGKLVANTRAAESSGCAATVDWFSPAEPTRHATGICAAGPPVIEGDRIAVKRRVTGSDAVEFVLSDLSGNTRTLARAGGALGLGGIDFDGTRAAYVAERCRGATASVYLDDLAPADPVEVPADCPVVPRDRRLRPTRTGQIQVHLTCADGCGGQVSLVRGSQLLSTERDFSGEGRLTVKLKLTRATRTRLARRGSFAATIQGVRKSLSDDGSEVFKRKVTLLPPR